MTTKSTITVVGGGLAGLVAAISAAEAGSPVVLHEAHAVLGGRARSTRPPYIANLGPHALYCDGPLWAWLRERDLAPPSAKPLLHGFRFRWNGAVRRTPPLALVRALPLTRRHRAPVDRTFREWARSLVGDEAAEALSSAAGVATFTADPGALSAAFVLDKLHRATKVPSAARFPIGGWTSVIDLLESRARALGVRIACGSPVDRLPDDGPVIVALDLDAARRLLDDASLVWPGARTTLLDVAVVADRKDPYVVSDLDEAGWVERFSAQDPSLAPSGHSLFQAQLGALDGESLDAAVARVEALLDEGVPGWRAREVWRRRSIVDCRTGALDHPGTTWRDRPAVDRGDGVFVCGDRVAAPGLLAEVAWASAVDAALRAVDSQLRSRAYGASARTRS
jgi:phytoene dehydrogenase-like protein